MDEPETDEELPVVEFTRLLMARLDREVGRAFTIDPEDMNPKDATWSTTFYVLDPDCRVFELSAWESKDLDVLRQVISSGLGTQPGAALEPGILARFGAEIADETTHAGVTYTGIVFESLMRLAEWAHIFAMEDQVNIVGVPTLTGRVSVNVATRT